MPKEKRGFTLFNFKKLIIICLFVLGLPALVKANNCPTTDYDCQIKSIQGEIDALKPAHEKNKEELSNLKTQVANLNKRISGISAELKKLKASTRVKNISKQLKPLVLQNSNFISWRPRTRSKRQSEYYCSSLPAGRQA